MQKQYRWLLIGPGDIAKDFANDLKLTKQATHQIVAVVGRTIEKAEAFIKDHPGAVAFDNLQKALDAGNIDAAYISTPHPLHYKESILCLQHKVPVLCEKPAALNALQLQEIIGTSKNNHCFFMEGMWIRFLPPMVKLLEIINSGELGNINSINADMSFKAPYDKANRYFNPDLGGGSLLDLGVYGIFLALTLLGKPSKIQAHAKLTGEQIDESCAFILGYEKGSYAVMESSFIKQTQMDAFIFADNGFIKILSPWMAKSPGIIINYFDGRPASEHHFEWEGRGFQFEVDAMTAALENGKTESAEIPHRFSMDMMQVTEAIKDLAGICYPAKGE